jgi:uncharacterized membrane protein
LRIIVDLRNIDVCFCDPQSFFLAVCLGVSNASENLSILTGFPFGWYHYSDAMGPKLFLVPLQIGPAYFGVGYLSWTLARAILGDEDTRLAGLLSFATPAMASFIMVSWDLTIDPTMSTIAGNWVWHNGGSYFGVPLSNFLGWYQTRTSTAPWESTSGLDRRVQSTRSV